MFSARFPMAWSWSLLNLKQSISPKGFPKILLGCVKRWNCWNWFSCLFISLLAYWAAISTWKIFRLNQVWWTTFKHMRGAKANLSCLVVLRTSTAKSQGGSNSCAQKVHGVLFFHHLPVAKMYELSVQRWNSEVLRIRSLRKSWGFLFCQKQHGRLWNIACASTLTLAVTISDRCSDSSCANPFITGTFIYSSYLHLLAWNWKIARQLPWSRFKRQAARPTKRIMLMLNVAATAVSSPAFADESPPRLQLGFMQWDIVATQALAHKDQYQHPWS